MGRKIWQCTVCERKFYTAFDFVAHVFSVPDCEQLKFGQTRQKSKTDGQQSLEGE